MRGDVVFRVYGLHEERDADSFFGAFRSRAEADAQIAELAARTMHGENWGTKFLISPIGIASAFVRLTIVAFSGGRRRERSGRRGRPSATAG